PVIPALPDLFGCPRLVIPGRARPLRAAQHRSWRIIGEGCTGHVRLVLFLPRVAHTVRARHLVDRMVQPGMPLLGHLGPFRLALIDDPALFTAGSPAAAPRRLGTPFAIVAVAESVGPNQLAPEPSQ